MQRFFANDFNNYKKIMFGGHQDNGYNGIVYFSDECGTNLYSTDTTDELPDAPEHYKPWRLREHYEILKTIEPKYNRLVLFDGFKFPHGVDVCNNHYFGDEYRKNQVFSFKIINTINTYRTMKVPNWQHHSKKEQKRTLKPQALRQAKARLRHLKKLHTIHPRKVDLQYYGLYTEKHRCHYKKSNQPLPNYLQLKI